MIEMPITLEPYGSYCNRLIQETHKMVKEMHDIVHCKDCVYFVDGNGCILQGWDYTWEEQMGADDFCSRGERKDDNKDKH